MASKHIGSESPQQQKKKKKTKVKSNYNHKIKYNFHLVFIPYLNVMNLFIYN